MTSFALIIILVVLGVIVGNLMLLKHSAKFSMKNINQDPIERAKQTLKERQSEDNSSENKQ